MHRTYYGPSNRIAASVFARERMDRERKVFTALVKKKVVCIPNANISVRVEEVCAETRPNKFQLNIAVVCVSLVKAEETRPNKFRLDS